VNLSAFETFFQEKRPFFQEGANIFDFSLGGGHSNETLFYSRRVGRAPQGSADPRGGFVDSPLNSTILAAGKLSGKTANGWSIGVLDAVTAEEKATVIDLEGVRHRDVIEPLTNYGVVRVQKDFNEGQSALGGIATTVHRQLPALLQYLRSSAYAGGVDGRHRFGDGNWEISGQLLASRVSGSPDAISSAQLNSAHYFQRPDAEHLDFDPSRRSLTGTSGALQFGKIGGGHWRGSISSYWVSPGFETNDLGFLRQADMWRNSLWIGYREFEPGKIFRRYNVNLNAWNWTTFGGERTATGGNLNGSFTLLNYWGGFAGVNREFAATNTRVLRGGPAMLYPASLNWWAGFFSDSRKKVVFEAGTFQWFDERSSRAGGFFGDIVLRPKANFRFALGPEYNATHDDWQYVTAQEAPRVEWTFTPDLSLQLYAAPFVSSGNYGGFKEVIDTKATEYSDRFDEFEPDQLSYQPSTDPDVPGLYEVDLNRDGTSDLSFSDPNFSLKEFRSTFVLRWEYMPGSTFFFVWAMNRSRFDFNSRFDPLSDLGALREIEGPNIFSVKINYYLNP
jgi:hypothetical protein